MFSLIYSKKQARDDLGIPDYDLKMSREARAALHPYIPYSPKTSLRKMYRESRRM